MHSLYTQAPSQWTHGRLSLSTWLQQVRSRVPSSQSCAACSVTPPIPGHAQWVDGTTRSSALVFQRTATELAGVLSAYAKTHALQGTVYTLYELRSGKLFPDAPFVGEEAALLLAASKELAKDGRAVVVEGKEPDECGVRFT